MERAKTSSCSFLQSRAYQFCHIKSQLCVMSWSDLVNRSLSAFIKERPDSYIYTSFSSNNSVVLPAMINEALSLREEPDLRRETSDGYARGRKSRAFSRFLPTTDEKEEKYFKIQKEVCIYSAICSI